MIFLDIHVVVWMYAGYATKLSEIAIDQIEKIELYISQEVRLELQCLFEIGRLTVAPETLIKSLGKSIGLKVSLMDVEQVFDQALVCNWTRDVFDRLITAEAETLCWVLITKDEKNRADYDKAIW